MDDKPISVLLTEDNRDHAFLMATELEHEGGFGVDVVEDLETYTDK